MPRRTIVFGTILFLLIFATSVIAQPTLAVVEKACGPQKAQFEVKRMEGQHALAEPESGKARVYFIQDQGIANCIGSNCVTVRIGLDGTWIGANQRNSYFSIAVEPGEHHLCANPQAAYLQRLVGLLRFTAEAGKTYYFRDRVFAAENQAIIDFEPIEREQAEYSIGSYPLSVSSPKK